MRWESAVEVIKKLLPHYTEDAHFFEWQVAMEIIRKLYKAGFHIAPKIATKEIIDEIVDKIQKDRKKN